ncbi:ABC transporter permease subunit [Defluviimonas sp. WL0002]|uniref:ABC transporter permease subunit n=1 Tax=Albidovulum marisflavi TaxID=2984159 RepID=A0ABT2ZDF3_9RHOB|nr:ABC transporter permease subunit [Defluviimonas sp. WL0002]MCV2869173.1 ABC transporter permease subunit [Defluviimonas sp. WL0002]
MRRRPTDERDLSGWAGWALTLALFVGLWLYGGQLFPWAFDYPRSISIPAARWITSFTKWLLNEATFGLFTFAELTRFIAAVLDVPYRFVLSLLSTGFQSGEGSQAVQILPPLSWVAVIGTGAILGGYAGGARLAALVAGCLTFVLVFGQWQSAMVTLASILVAVPLGVAGGLLLGILAFRHSWFERAIRPVLDLMQTIPVFAYLVPILILFGFGPTAAVVATLIYAMPPMTRITELALRRVPAELTDLGRMVGCTRRQMMWRVLVPASKDPLMVGVNQVIMLSLNMVIIASMIGAGGLGFDVLAALRRLDFGAGLEAGLAIVALAVALDRLSQAFARLRNEPARGNGPVARHPYLLSGVALILAAGLAGLAVPALQTWPDAFELSTGAFWSNVVQWINVNFFDTIEAVKNAVLLNLLVPFKRFLGGLPWAGVTALLAYVGWRLGGWRLAVLVASLAGLIAATGQWEKAAITVYLCGISTVFAMLIGVPIGILASEREGVWAPVRIIIDTLQTLPSFVYLMPAVMLFRVGDFTAMIAVVAYAVVPAVRYTVLGLKGVDPRLTEAGRAMGCTPGQILWRIKLRLALPEILLGLNQTVMFALSMLVITALVGTRDLGQEVYIALTKADPGRGLVAGLAVAFIAIITDRLISASARAARARLGLEAA